MCELKLEENSVIKAGGGWDETRQRKETIEKHLKSKLDIYQNS